MINKLIELPRNVGGYWVSPKPYGIMFNFTVKRSTWHRLWCRICLGWIWEDK